MVVEDYGVSRKLRVVEDNGIIRETTRGCKTVI